MSGTQYLSLIVSVGNSQSISQKQTNNQTKHKGLTRKNRKWRECDNLTKTKSNSQPRKYTGDGDNRTNRYSTLGQAPKQHTGNKGNLKGGETTEGGNIIQDEA